MMPTTVTRSEREQQLQLVMEHFGVDEKEAEARVARLESLAAAERAEPGYYVDDVVAN